MPFTVQHIRSGEFAKRPAPQDLASGQIAVNYNNDSPGLFFKTDTGTLIKVGPPHIGASAPQQQNWTERSLGEMWLDTTLPELPLLKVYTQTGWLTVGGAAGSGGSGGSGGGGGGGGSETITSNDIVDGAVTAEKITLNGSLVPTEDDQFALGSSAHRFSSLHTDELFADKLSQSIIPNTSSITLGSTGNSFLEVHSASIYAQDVYTGDLHLKNDKGDWTVIEEEQYLTLRNNSTGKRFKILMEEID